MTAQEMQTVLFHNSTIASAGLGQEVFSVGVPWQAAAGSRQHGLENNNMVFFSPPGEGGSKTP